MSISDSDGIPRWQIGAGMFIADVIIGGTRPYGYGFRVASRNDQVVDAVGASVGRRCVHRDGILRQRPPALKALTQME
jgi:hypothetical protein